VGAASLLLNYAVSVHKSMDEETQIQLISVLSINFLTFITGSVHCRHCVEPGTAGNLFVHWSVNGF
jgi:hypothetical protein